MSLEDEFSDLIKSIHDKVQSNVRIPDQDLYKLSELVEGVLEGRDHWVCSDWESSDC